MHLLIAADGRSPITQNWIKMTAGLGWRISLISTFPCGAVAGAQLVAVLPVGFSALGGGQVKITGSSSGGWKRQLLNRFRPLALALRAWLAPLMLKRFQKRFAEIATDLEPDAVHALRIPFEGMLAESTPGNIPLILSVWGNDLTLHARTSPLMGLFTRRALRRADGLMADAERDLALAETWGLRAGRPTLVLPGGGGLDLDALQGIIANSELPFELPAGRPIVVNPRGFRPGSVHQDVFFKSIPLVLKEQPDAFFVCTALAGQPQAERWVEEAGLEAHVRLLPYLPQAQLWRLYARSSVYVSLSSHDGTPNTFLEALACGCFPVVGNITSLRAWLQDGSNGLLVDARDPRQAAEAIIQALADETLRKDAREKNRMLIESRAEISQVRAAYQAFMKKLVAG